MCTALVYMQQNNAANYLLSAFPPLVRRKTTSHGPKMCTYVGGAAWSVSVGRLAICLCSDLPRCFLHVTHLKRRLVMHLLAPIIQNLAPQMVPSVKCLPWCFTAWWYRRTSRVAKRCLPRMIMWLVSSVPSFDCVMRPPTLSNQLLSMMGASWHCFEIWFNSLRKHLCCRLLIMKIFAFSGSSLTRPVVRQMCQPWQALSGVDWWNERAIWISKCCHECAPCQKILKPLGAHYIIQNIFLSGCDQWTYERVEEVKRFL